MAADADVEPARFPHTCESCRFLGPFERVDLYHCYNSQLSFSRPLLIARFGSHGGDYETWRIASAGEPLEQPFIEAAARARRAGLELY